MEVMKLVVVLCVLASAASATYYYPRPYAVVRSSALTDKKSSGESKDFIKDSSEEHTNTQTEEEKDQTNAVENQGEENGYQESTNQPLYHPFYLLPEQYSENGKSLEEAGLVDVGLAATAQGHAGTVAVTGSTSHKDDKHHHNDHHHGGYYHGYPPAHYVAGPTIYHGQTIHTVGGYGSGIHVNPIRPFGYGGSLGSFGIHGVGAPIHHVGGGSLGSYASAGLIGSHGIHGGPIHYPGGAVHNVGISGAGGFAGAGLIGSHGIHGGPIHHPGGALHNVGISGAGSFGGAGLIGSHGIHGGPIHHHGGGLHNVGISGAGSFGGAGLIGSLGIHGGPIHHSGGHNHHVGGASAGGFVSGGFNGAHGIHGGSIHHTGGGYVLPGSYGHLGIHHGSPTGWGYPVHSLHRDLEPTYVINGIPNVHASGSFSVSEAGATGHGGFISTPGHPLTISLPATAVVQEVSHGPSTSPNHFLQFIHRPFQYLGSIVHPHVTPVTEHHHETPVHHGTTGSIHLDIHHHSSPSHHSHHHGHKDEEFEFAESVLSPVIVEKPADKPAEPESAPAAPVKQTVTDPHPDTTPAVPPTPPKVVLNPAETREEVAARSLPDIDAIDIDSNEASGNTETDTSLLNEKTEEVGRALPSNEVSYDVITDVSRVETDMKSMPEAAIAEVAARSESNSPATVQSSDVKEPSNTDMKSMYEAAIAEVAALSEPNSPATVQSSDVKEPSNTDGPVTSSAVKKDEPATTEPTVGHTASEEKKPNELGVENSVEAIKS